MVVACKLLSFASVCTINGCEVGRSDLPWAAIET